MPTVSRTGGRVHLVARSRVAVSGSPLFMDSIRCWTGRSTMWTSQHVPWTPARGNRFSSPVDRRCPSPQPWHAVIGWPNHRVAFISYADVGGILHTRLSEREMINRVTRIPPLSVARTGVATFGVRG
jgi:hypothetical protein